MFSSRIRKKLFENFKSSVWRIHLPLKYEISLNFYKKSTSNDHSFEGLSWHLLNFNNLSCLCCVYRQKLFSSFQNSVGPIFLPLRCLLLLFLHERLTLSDQRFRRWVCYSLNFVYWVAFIVTVRGKLFWSTRKVGCANIFTTAIFILAKFAQTWILSDDSLRKRAWNSINFIYFSFLYF